MFKSILPWHRSKTKLNLAKRQRRSDAIIAIDEYAFRTSDYPLILSLENHCNIEQQRKMSQIMLEVFKEKLLVAPVDPNETLHPR